MTNKDEGFYKLSEDSAHHKVFQDVTFKPQQE